MSNLKYIAALLLISLVPGYGFGQESKMGIDLGTVLEMSGAQNLTIKNYQERQKLVEAESVEAQSWWLPDIMAGASYHTLSGADMNTDGRIFRDVNREYLWGGVGFQAQWDFGEAVYKKEAAALKQEASRYATQEQKNQAILKSVKAYFDLQAAQMERNVLASLAEQSDTLVQQLKIQVNRGLRYQSEYLTAKSRHKRIKIRQRKARQNMENASSRLRRLLNMEDNTMLISTDSVMSAADLVDTSEAEPENAYKNRPLSTQQRFRLEALRSDKKRTTKGLLLPELRAGAYQTLYGSTSERFDPTSSLNISLAWNIPLGRIFHKGRLRKMNSRIRLQENRIQQARNRVQDEVRQARQKFKSAQEQLRWAREAVDDAEKAFNQSMQRQKKGTVEPFEVFQNQEFLMQAQMDYYKALAQYNQAQYSLYVALGNNL